VAGWAATALTTTALDPWTPPLGVSLAAVCATFLLTTLALPRGAAGDPTPPPTWDLPLRAGATAAIVLAVTGLAGVAGAHLAGMLAAFPVLASVLAAFTHAQDGAGAAAALLRGMLRGLVSFAVFCFVVAAILPGAGQAVAFLAASAAALAVHAAVGAAGRPGVQAPVPVLKKPAVSGDTPARTTS
jgi:hypothetical protein